jgi:DinB family protein
MMSQTAPLELLMPETHDAYQARLRAYTEGKDPIAMQRAAPGTIAKLIAGLPDEALRRAPAPGKWSAVEIVAHLAEDELTSTWRYRQMIEHPGGPLSGFDQDLWAKLGDYAAWPPRDALAMFRLLREANLRMLEKLAPEQWDCFGVHAERGRINVKELARHMAAHDCNHIEQIRAIVGRQ